MLAGIDVSRWQATTPLGHAPDFVMIRASIGDRTDPMCPRHYNAAEQAGKLVGFYHYCQPDATGKNAESEADVFVDAVGPRVGQALLALDFESAGNRIWGKGAAVEGAWVARFATRCREQVGVWPCVYVQGSAVRRVDQVAAFCPLWLAQYPKAGGVQSVTTHEAAIQHGFPSNDSQWTAATLWQFTSHLDGVSLDGDLFAGSENDWLQLASPSSKTTDPDQVTSVEHVVQAGDCLCQIGVHFGVA